MGWQRVRYHWTTNTFTFDKILTSGRQKETESEWIGEGGKEGEIVKGQMEVGNRRIKGIRDLYNVFWLCQMYLFLQKVKVKCKSLRCVQIFVTAWTVACQSPLSMGSSRQEYWSGLPCPPPGDLPDPGIKLHLLHWQVDSLPLSHPGSLNLSLLIIIPFSLGYKEVALLISPQLILIWVWISSAYSFFSHATQNN